MNKALVEARRDSRQPNANAANGAEAFGTPEGQFAIALQLAENEVRGGMEKFVHMYPEVPAEEINRLRANPWAFVSRKTFLSGDVETALIEIETALLERAEEVGAKNNPPNAQPAGATVNANPAPEPQGEEADSGSDEDENPWTMPLDKLGKKAKKEVASKTSE